MSMRLLLRARFCAGKRFSTQSHLHSPPCRSPQEVLPCAISLPDAKEKVQRWLPQGHVVVTQGFSPRIFWFKASTPHIRSNILVDSWGETVYVSGYHRQHGTVHSEPRASHLRGHLLLRNLKDAVQNKNSGPFFKKQGESPVKGVK